MRTRHTRPLFASLLVMSLLISMTGVCVGQGGDESPLPSAGPSPAPSDQIELLDVAVLWDGTGCIYEGPTVIPAGTLVRFAYSVDGEVGIKTPLLVIIGVEPGTTWDPIVEHTSTRPASAIPDWVILTGYTTVVENSSGLFTITNEIAGMPVGGYFIGCATAPASDGGSDTMYPAALLEVAEA